MHPVNCDKLFRERVRNPEVVRCGPWNSTHQLASTQPPEQILDRLARESPPVSAHPNLQRRMAKNRRRPLDGMDLRYQCSIHQPSMLENFVVVPERIRQLQGVTDRIVLQCEECEQHLQPHPPSCQCSALHLHQGLTARVHEVVLAQL